MRRLSSALAFAAALVAAGGGARAQVEDFATCPADLPACSATVTNCCYRSFDPSGSDRAIIIPLDRCHQRLAASGKLGPPSSSSPAWCADSPASADNGLLHAYGLVYRLMQNGIHVYWLINPTKDPPALTNAENAASQTYTERDIDFWVLNSTTSSPPKRGSSLTSCGAGCTDPVERIDPSTMTPIADSYNQTAFPVRGSAFVIAAEDRARFNNFIRRTGEFASHAGDSHYDFSAVDMYEITSGSSIVYQDYRTSGPNYTLFNGGGFSAPVALRIDYAPPRLARQAPAGVSQVWLADAKLDSPADSTCRTGAGFTPSDAVYCDVSETDIQAGALVNGQFEWAWIDNWSDNSPCGDAAETTQVDKVREFLTAVPGVRPGGHVMLMDAVLGVFESSACGDRQPAGLLGTGIATSTQTPNEPLILRYPNNTFMQWGDLPTDFASGSAAKWQYYGNGALGYDPSHLSASGTLVRLVTEDRSDTGNALCSDHKSTASCDVYATNGTGDQVDAALYLRFKDDPRNGVVFYQGGNNVNGRVAQERLILNSLITLPEATVPVENNPPVEVSRSSPIVATVGGTEYHYQGTYEVNTPPLPVTTYSGAMDDSSFEFPYTKGHLRAVRSSDLSSSETDFASLPSVFDVGADGAIPDPSDTGCSNNFTGTCRTVFTTIESPTTTDGLVQRPDRVFLNTGNVAQLKPLMGPSLTDTEGETLISRVLAGVPDGSGGYKPELGGVDRSTMAVIEASPLIASSSDRPTMIYFGATDGMLHAVCAEAKGVCPAAGRELWAFIPRTQLPYLRLNTTRIDGSPKVADVFDDFDPTDGVVRREWRTILTFQIGSGNAGDPSRAPAVIALDITDPGNPVVLWERTSPSTRSSIDLGVGLGLAMGPARVSGQIRNLTLAETNNGGTSGKAGFYLGAIDTSSGQIVWEVKQAYANPRDSANPPVPTTGIPGGAVAVDLDSSSLITHVLVPSLYGELWEFTAGGVNPFGTKPLFRFSGDYHPIGAPPAVYFDMGTGRMYAAIASGGYADPVGSSWAPDGVDQFLVSVAIDANAGNVPIDETGSGFGSDRAFVQNVGPNRAYAQAVVAGNELFVTTDSSDVNASTYGTTGQTGSLRRYALSTGAQKGSTIVVAGGASSTDVTSSGVVHVGSGGGAEKIDVSQTGGGGAFDAQGTIIEHDATDGTKRLLWISS